MFIFRVTKKEYRKLKKTKQTTHCTADVINETKQNETLAMILKSQARYTGKDYVLKESSKMNEGKDYVNTLLNDTWLYDQRLGKDSVGLMHASIEVKKIFRICNDSLWTKYNETIKNSKHCLSRFPKELVENPIVTTYSKIYVTNPGKFNIPLKPNEVHLFHGTKFANILGIAERGFDLGKANKGLYGTALYMAESSEKADQYAGLYVVTYYSYLKPKIEV